MAKWAKITKDHTVVTKKSRSGAHRGEVDFKASEEPVPVTQKQLDALVAAGAGEEVSAPADKGTDKSGQAGKPVDRASADKGADKGADAASASAASAKA